MPQDKILKIDWFPLKSLTAAVILLQASDTQLSADVTTTLAKDVSTQGALSTSPGSMQFQKVEVNFAQTAGPPIVKTKFGVYQTPLTTLPRLLDSLPLLREVGVTDFRYEMGWGKPDALASSQIGGTAAQPTYNFAPINALVDGLKREGVKPLLAMTYCPQPLQSRTGWEAWKDMPSDLESWRKINSDYVSHLKNAKKVLGPYYEIWNEPDMPDPKGKMFFHGSPQDYGRLYDAAAGGIRQGDPDALIGGPAAAYDLAYLTPILSQPMDFASIHGYDNYTWQLGAMRSALAKRPDLPIFLTEYASYAELPPNGPQSRYMAAMRFFRDVKGLLTYQDVAKVYWAQWLDAGNGPGMGLITWDGHRKALFNAFKIYSSMPVDRVSVEPESSKGIGAMASSDKNRACVVLWNESSTAREVRVNLRHLPFASSVMQVYRIDRNNASYLDNPQSEELRALQTMTLPTATVPSWTGTIPGASVVFLHLSTSEVKPRPAFEPVGVHIRSYHWFHDRKSNAYADFDARTGTARLGMGDNDFAVAPIGSLIDRPGTRWRVQVEKSGPFHKHDQNSLFGIRLDFPSEAGGYSRSVLFHNGLYDPQRNYALPWGKGGAVPDQAIQKNALNTGRSFEINLLRIAPRDWDRQRIVITFILQNVGRNSRAKFTFNRS